MYPRVLLTEVIEVWIVLVVVEVLDVLEVLDVGSHDAHSSVRHIARWLQLSHGPPPSLSKLALK